MTVIIGAGMAGLLAGNVVRGGTIYDIQPNLPNNHHALLRFRSSVVGDYLGIPFREVQVMKATVPYSNPVADALSYSFKCNGRYGFRSSTTADGSISRRFIAPGDFIQRMADMFPGNWKLGSGARGSKALRDPDVLCISTIPMPSLMSILEYPDIPEFKSRKGFVIECELEIESSACATLYYPDPRSPITRATLTEGKLQIELMRGDVSEWDVIRRVIEDFGIDTMINYSYEIKEQAYGKIESIDDRQRRKFIMWATDNFNVYSLGRFATWKPGLLLDDVLGDLFKIRKMIQSGDNYFGRIPSATNDGEQS